MHLLRSVLCLLVATPLMAQSRLLRDTEIRAVPEGTVIATVQSGTSWRTGAARGGFTQVTLEGWIDATRVGAKRDTFPASIGGAGTLRLRAEPSLNGRILGVFEAGAGIRVLERKDNWARVRRDGWVLSSTVAAPTPTKAAATKAPQRTETKPASRPETKAPAKGTAATTADPATDEPAPRLGAIRADSATTLSLAPGSAPVAVLAKGAIVDPIARDRGWVRVRLEAWVPEDALVAADSSVVASITAADLRLDPTSHRGRTVRWNVRVVSLQRADGLRPALGADEPYLLAMGPGGESAILYLAVPPSLADEAKALPSMSEITITARVRNGRSEPTGAPVLDLLSIIKR